MKFYISSAYVSLNKIKLKFRKKGVVVWFWFEYMKIKVLWWFQFTDKIYKKPSRFINGSTRFLFTDKWNFIPISCFQIIFYKSRNIKLNYIWEHYIFLQFNSFIHHPSNPSRPTFLRYERNSLRTFIIASSYMVSQDYKCFFPGNI